MTTYPVTELMQRTVRDIMHHRVITVFEDTPLSDAARLLWDERVSGVPVIDRQRRPVGFLSASDIVRFEAFGLRYQPPSSAETVRGLAAADLEALAPGVVRSAARQSAVARDVMTPVTLSVRSCTTVPELARFLVRAGIHHALVVDRGELIGVVSTFDLVEEVAAMAPPEEEPELPLPVATEEEC